MDDIVLAALRPRRGHVVFESGDHGDLWLDLDGAWTAPWTLAPLEAELANRLPSGQFEVVCGPMTGGAFAAFAIASQLELPFCFADRVVHTAGNEPRTVEYVLPASFRGVVANRRVAVIDDVMNASVAAQGTVRALEAAGARATVLGALLVLGNAVPAFADRQGMELITLANRPGNRWTPERCPLCAAGTPLEVVAL